MPAYPQPAHVRACGLGLVLLLAWLVTGVGAAHAGLFDALSRGARTVRAAGTLEQAARLLHTLPPRGDRAVLAASASHEGHWRFVNRAGEVMTAATPEEMGRTLAVLSGTAGDARRALALYLTEDTAFLHRGQLKDLPRQAELHVLVGETAYPLVRTGTAGAERLWAEVRPRLVVELTSRPLFDEALWQLARPLARAGIRQIALEPGGPVGFQGMPRLDPATGRALTDSIEPDRLVGALAGIRGQTALLTGRVEQGRLVYKPASGAERSLGLAEVERAAEAADVNLVVLRSSSSRQPGTRNWLWLRAEVGGLEAALDRATLGDFLDAVEVGGGRMAVAVTDRTVLRARLVVQPAAELAAGSLESLSTRWSEIVTEVTARAAVHGVEAALRSAERQDELDHRIIPGIPADVQFIYLGMLLTGLLGASVSWRWWGRLWPPESRSEYGGASGYWAANAVRALAYGLVFAPVVALPAFSLAILMGARAHLLALGRAIGRLVGVRRRSSGSP